MTGILPVQTVDLPARFIDAALSDIGVSFRVGPLVTTLQPSVDRNRPDIQAVGLPTPAEQNGAWSWWELQETPEAHEMAWTSHAINRSDDKAHLSGVAQTLREGALQLETKLNEVSR